MWEAIIMIIAISDVHLGSNDCKREDFLNFVNSQPYLKDENHFLLLGDIIEFTLRDMTNAIQENEEILQALLTLKEKGFSLHYIVGNHDIIIREMKNNEHFPFDIRDNMTISHMGIDYYFTHGYEIEAWTLFRKDVKAYEDLFRKNCGRGEIEARTLKKIWEIIEPIWNLLKASWYFLSCNDIASKINRGAFRSMKLDMVETLAFSPLLNMFIPIKENDILVFGHTHKPFKTKKVINTGSWVENDKYKYCTYLRIDDFGKIQLFEWKKGNPEEIPSEDVDKLLAFSRRNISLRRRIMRL
jgi:UDP-2,3-diacylglucosamine pyrophosphatase LpxH